MDLVGKQRKAHLPVKKFERVLAGAGLRADIRFLGAGSHSVWNDELRTFIHDDMDRVVRSAAGPDSAEKTAAAPVSKAPEPGC